MSKYFVVQAIAYLREQVYLCILCSTYIGVLRSQHPYLYFTP
ncbi:hypothetical protein [Dendronalium phyllosphericum]|nr:hypothetical protein [Dendronalium phyllosphericum]